MFKVLDVYYIPNADLSSVILSGECPKYINNEYKIKKGNLIIPLENITIGRDIRNTNNKTFGISIKGSDIQNGDFVEFIR